MAAKAERLHLRLDANTKSLLDEASQATDTTVSAFVLHAAAHAAAEVLADRRAFALDETSWRIFDHALTRPARDIAGLRDLLHTPTALTGTNPAGADPNDPDS